jgi:hypothetical protein
MSPATLRGPPSGQRIQSHLLDSKGMTSDGLATTDQYMMARLCGSQHRHEAGPDGGARSLRVSHPSTGWAERVSDARIACITGATHSCAPHLSLAGETKRRASLCNRPPAKRRFQSMSKRADVLHGLAARSFLASTTCDAPTASGSAIRASPATLPATAPAPGSSRPPRSSSSSRGKGNSSRQCHT